MVLKPGKEAEAEAIFRKWGLDFADHRPHHPTPALRRPAPRRGRWPTCRSRSSATRRRSTTGPTSKRRSGRRSTPPTVTPPMSNVEALLNLIGSPDLCSKRWVWEQYDHLILRQHRAAPGRRRRRRARHRRTEGAGADHRRDAALLRGRPVRGRQAGGGRGLAQPHRGRRPAARHHRQPEFRQSRNGPRSWASSSAASAASARPAGALDFPVVSGNVSLYNETNGRGDPADARPSAASA